MVKKYIRIGIVILVSLLAISTYTLYTNNQKLKEEISISMSNQKAFIAENSLLKEENRVFKFTIEQLNHYNDSILQKMNEVRKELKIKDKDLKQMQYLLSEAQKKDTTLKIDTLLGDRWYQMKLGLRYPSTIITEPKFVSEKYVIVDYKKETINPPKKCAIARWFQKKHKVIEVNVVEKNPYIENKKSKFIEVIK